MDSEDAKRIYNIRLDSPNYGNDVNHGVCLHIMAQCRKFEPEIFSDDDIIRANAILIIISRTIMMMDKYIKSIGNEFVEQGGFRERMSTVRTEARTKQDGVPEEGPVCPNCGSPTRLRKTREGNKRFWGCTGYPSCKGVVNFQENQSDRNR